MTKAIFYHKTDSSYDDDPALRYHFPKRYLSRVQSCENDRIIYYGPVDKKRGYWATARVDRVDRDPERTDHYYAYVSEYIDFDRLVPHTENGGYEGDLFLPDGRVSGGRAVQAVRLVPDDEFAAIAKAGLSQPDEWPDRTDQPETDEQVDGFEESQADFERPVVQQLLNRKFRDQKFRQHVRKVYDRTCAFTGLRLINGLGRPEVEAAHIQPVHMNGPDSVRNGIALSGTVHWMFDRGLLSLEDDFTILKSRHLNHDVSHLLVPDMIARVPSEPKHQPHPIYLDWHRANCFKH